MISGSLIAPFCHDLSWPENITSWFRAAVYYHHVPASGLDPVNFLRELTNDVLCRTNPEDKDGWTCLKNACDKSIHLKLEGVNQRAMRNLVHNLLIFTNLLLIRHYGLMTVPASLRFVMDDPERQEAYEAGVEGAQRALRERIGLAYESLENAIEEMKQRPRPEVLRFVETAKALSPIPDYLRSIKAEDKGVFRLTLSRSRNDGCFYEFRPHDPIGWEMTNGAPARDRFANDDMSSKGVFGKRDEVV